MKTNPYGGLFDAYTRMNPFEIQKGSETGQALEDGSDVTFTVSAHTVQAEYSNLPEDTKPMGRIMLRGGVCAEMPGRLNKSLEGTKEAFTFGGGMPLDAVYTYEARVKKEGKPGTTTTIKKLEFKLSREP